MGLRSRQIFCGMLQSLNLAIRQPLKCFGQGNDMNIFVVWPIALVAMWRFQVKSEISGDCNKPDKRRWCSGWGRCYWNDIFPEIFTMQKQQNSEINYTAKMRERNEPRTTLNSVASMHGLMVVMRKRISFGVGWGEWVLGICSLRSLRTSKRGAAVGLKLL